MELKSIVIKFQNENRARREITKTFHNCFYCVKEVNEIKVGWSFNGDSCGIWDFAIEIQSGKFDLVTKDN